MNNTHAIALGGVVLGAIGVFILLQPKTAPSQNPGNENGAVCTTDVKQCPDGSYVGRTGPKCEFAACPSVSVSKVLISAKIGRLANISGLELTPIKVTEDSRCPVDVTCIQAGTVKVEVRLKSGSGQATQVFTLNEPVTTETETITLIEAFPPKKAGVQITNAQYQFTFEVEKRTSTP